MSTKIALTPRDVARELDCSLATVYRWMQNGRLKYWSPSPRKRFVAPSTLERLVAGDPVDQETAA